MINTNSHSSTADNNLSSIEEFFNEKVSVEDLSRMSESERQSFFEKLYADHEISEEKQKEFLEQFQTECENLSDDIHISVKELESLIKDGNLSVTEKASVELVIADLEEIEEFCDGDKDISELAEDAFEEYQNQNLKVEAGTVETISSSDLSDNDYIKVDASALAKENESGSSFDIKEEGYVDSDGDNVTDRFWDEDGDGRADDDFNNDNVIDEFDSPFYEGQNPTTVTLDLAEGDTLYLSSFDDTQSPYTSVFKITKENGDTAYVEITGEPTIYANPAPTNLESMPLSLTSRMFETPENTRPYSFYTDGYDPLLDIDAFTLVDMDDKDNAYDLAPTSDDFLSERTYTITMDAGKGDNLNIILDEFPDAEVELEEQNETLVFTVKTDQGEIKIKVDGVQHSATEGKADIINFSSGELTDSSYDTINTLEVSGATSDDTPLVGALANIITLSGEPLSTSDEAAGSITTYNMSSEGHALTMDISSDDFSNNTEYDVNFVNGTADDLSLNFPSDAKITFSQSESGQLTIIATTSNGTVKIKCHGLEFEHGVGPTTDLISIHGGSVGLSFDDYEAMNEMVIPLPGTDELYYGTVFFMIYVEDTSLFDYAFQETEYVTTGNRML